MIKNAGILFLTAAMAAGTYVAYEQSITPVNVPPLPTLVLVSNGCWHVEWNPGSESTRSNYAWFIQSSTNLAVPMQDEEQWYDATTNDLIYRPQPNYFFRLHGITNRPGI